MSRLVQNGIFSGFVTALVFCANHLYAAPLENGSLAASISPGDARLQVLAAAEKYERTPYRYGGMDRYGLDCSGLVYVSFYDALGVSIPRNTSGLYAWVEKISINDARPGDLVFFKTTGNGSVSHVGIFAGNGRFIHAASEGPVTGVMYSSLDERYWSRTYAGAGRVLPEADIYGSAGSKNAKETKEIKETRETKEAKKSSENKENNLLIGFAIAPTWNTFFADENVIRGAAGQLYLEAAVKPFGTPVSFGMELRPEWDRMLGVFRLPLTLSLGFNDKVRFFAGPALSFGDAALTVLGEKRQYAGGTSWFGAAGMTVTPFSFRIARVSFAPYGELAWQSYYSNNTDRNIFADFTAGFRFSTGLRCTWRKL